MGTGTSKRALRRNRVRTETRELERKVLVLTQKYHYADRALSREIRKANERKEPIKVPDGMMERISHHAAKELGQQVATELTRQNPQLVPTASIAAQHIADQLMSCVNFHQLDVSSMVDYYAEDIAVTLSFNIQNVHINRRISKSQIYMYEDGIAPRYRH